MSHHLRKDRELSRHPDRVNRAITFAAIALLSSLALAATRYTMKGAATVTGPYTVRVQISTNLPDGVSIGARLKPLEAKGGDPALALGLHRAVVKGGKATFNIDEWDSTWTVPQGKYNVGVLYSPLWPENERFMKKGLEDFVTLNIPVSLVGDGVAYRNILIGRKRYDALKVDFAFMKAWTLAGAKQQYGPAVLVKPTRPNDLEAGSTVYYFPKVDSTFVVNAKGQLTNIRGGRYYR